MIRRTISKIITFDRIMFVRQNLFKQPAQTSKEIKAIKLIFEYYKHRKISIFEYGCGYSTVYYARYLYENEYDFEWHGVDNSENWFNRTKAIVKSRGYDKNVFLYLTPFKPFWEKGGFDLSELDKCRRWSPTSENEDKYINFPRSCLSKFDIIFIDGRFRRRCLLFAEQCLNKGGVVILHDAQKKHYHTSLKAYQYQTFINGGKFYPGQRESNKIWLGSNDNANPINLIKKNSNE